MVRQCGVVVGSEKQHGWEWDMNVLLGVGAPESHSHNLGLYAAASSSSLYVMFVYLCLCTPHLDSPFIPSPPYFEAVSHRTRDTLTYLFPMCEVYRQAPPQLAFLWVLRTQTQSSCLHGWHSIHRATFQLRVIVNELFLYGECLH